LVVQQEAKHKHHFFIATGPFERCRYITEGQNQYQWPESLFACLT
jgi:hypothetical protein